MSVKSMTGYGRAIVPFEEREINVDIKSVNHRYFDFTAKISKDYSFLEDKIKAKVNKAVSRGKIDLYLFIDNAKDSGYEIEINEDLAKSYNDAFSSLAKKIKVKNDLKISFFSRIPELVKFKKKEIDEKVLEQQVMIAVDKALESYDTMRVTEGKKLEECILTYLDTILENVSKIEALVPKSIEAYKQRLKAKMLEAIGDKDVDEQRLITEVAIFADKIDVGEETVRLRSHIDQFKQLLNTDGEAVGKKLDFIVQEMNREINTTGSKCNSIEITRLVVDTKSVIEKIREQIQNIE